MNAYKIEDFQALSKTQVEAASSFAATMSKGLQEIATETAEYSKHVLASSAEAVERLMGARSVETAVQIQSEYAKSAYAGFVAKSTKINEIFVKVASEAMKPAQNAFATFTPKV